MLPIRGTPRSGGPSDRAGGTRAHTAQSRYGRFHRITNRTHPWLGFAPGGYWQLKACPLHPLPDGTIAVRSLSLHARYAEGIFTRQSRLRRRRLSYQRLQHRFPQLFVHLLGLGHGVG